LVLHGSLSNGGERVLEIWLWFGLTGPVGDPGEIFKPNFLVSPPSEFVPIGQLSYI
jgi:hypothetical protein